MITGPSGIGKSTIVKLVALQLQRTNGYQILSVTCPKDIVYFDPNIKQMYIIDDICGKFSVDQSMINSWENVNRQILKYSKDNKDFRVLGTCRLEISISSPFRKLRKIYGIMECNLLQEKFVYSKEEKLKIAACHIDEEIIKQLDDKILNAYNMFPLLCMMYAASESNPGVEFFQYPIKAFKEQLGKMNEQNECCFIGLALIVVYNNKLYKHLLQNGDDKKFEDVFNKVFEELGLRNKPSKRSVLSGLQAQEGIYTKELESTITVIHDKIFDILSWYFGKRIPKAILAHGSGTFIAERFLFESVKDNLKIVLPSELEDSYFNRMVEEIENNRFYNVFKNVQVCNELYQEKFISFLSKHEHQSIIQKLLCNHWPLYLSSVSGCKLLVEFILNEQRTSGRCNKLDKDGNHQDMLMDRPESDMYVCNIDTDNGESTTIDNNVNDEDDAYRIQFENAPMVAACEGGYIDIVECLVENGYNIDHSDSDLPTPLFSACKYGNKDVVDFLLKRNCKVNAIDNNHQIALHAACKNGNIDIVNSLLKCNSNINLCDIYGHIPLFFDTTSHRTPIYYACLNGHTDIVQILLDNNCDIHHDAIHGACEGGYKDIVEILIKHNVDINQRGGKLGKTPIYYACHNGHTDIVQILLDNKCDIHDAMHGACGGGYKDIVEILIKHNVDINFSFLPDLCLVGCSYYTPIVFACDNGHPDIVKLLLDNNCDVLDKDGFSNILHYACRGGFVDIVDLLLIYNCNINQCCPRTNQSPLIVACAENKEAVVKLLLSYEACDVNIIDNDNCNALHYACREGQSDVVELLLKHHCNVNLNDSFKKTPLFIACEEGHVDIVKILINQDNCLIDVLDVEGNGLLHAPCGQSYVNPIQRLNNLCKTAHQFYSANYDRHMFYSTKNDHAEIIRILLGKNCDVNVLNKKGQSVLYAACVYGQTEIVDILLSSNSNVNQCDEAKKTPLFIACENGYIDIVRLLIKSKCEIFNHSLNGQTVLHAVCSAHHKRFETFTEGLKDILILLIDQKCDVNISDNNSQTPLHIACYKGNVALVEILLRNKCECDVNISDNNSQTPLHIACYNGNVALVEILLKNKCVVDQCDNLNKTPFFLACEGGHEDVVKSLMKFICNMNIRDKIGRSALHAVCAIPSIGYEDFDRGVVQVAELLINKICGVYDLDDAGQSALHGACKQDNPEMVKLLLQNKFNVDQRDKMDETPIFNACRGYPNNAFALELLIKKNCDVNVLNINGLNALNIAFDSGCIRKSPMETHFKRGVKLLVDSGCSVNICDTNGQTPLHRACSEGYVDVAELFLKRNSNINQCDKLMKTPLILAVEGGHTKVVTMLVENKCDIDISDKDGRTALDIAEENQVVDIKNILLNVMKKDTNAQKNDACTTCKKAKYF